MNIVVTVAKVGTSIDGAAAKCGAAERIDAAAES
jgi:hypothetical protein